MMNRQTEIEPLFVSPTEAARLISASRSKTYELIRAGVIPSVRIGSLVRVSVDQLREWQRNQAASEGHAAA
jgi:excisionase family DNA binding protein